MASRNNILGKDPEHNTFEKDYILGKVLGKGAFGLVRVAKDKKTGSIYACKTISKAKLVTRDDVEDVRREAEILHLVSDHNNVARLIGSYEDKTSVHFVLELCRGGELFDRIISKGFFSEKEAAFYFRTMVEVVAHCHQLGVMHRDLKPENFLLESEEDAALLKAADFGLSAYFKPGQTFSQVIGSAYYVAPEVLNRNYGPEADLWSLGVILYILLSGMPPFWGNTEQDIFKMILQGHVDLKTDPWPKISPQAKDLVSKLLVMDTKKRATAKQALEHPWLKEQGVAPDKPMDNVVIARMKKFAALNKMTKAAILIAAKSLSTEELSGLIQLFKSIDEDGSGTVTIDELRKAFLRYGTKFNDEDLQVLMKAADLDGDGTINYEEFVACTVSLAKLDKQETYVKAFKHFDKDGSGSISADEIAEGLRSYGGMSDDEIKELIKTYDKNSDGMIDYNEFVSMMQRDNKELEKAASVFRTAFNIRM